MSEKKPLRFGLVGAGAIAQAYLPAFDKAEAVTLAAVADINPDAAGSMAEAAGCAAFGSVTQMADEMELDAVVVSTPPVTHGEMCGELFDRKINVLCEKPLAIDSATAERMIARAEEAGVVFTMASKFRFVADVAKAKSLLASGTIGEPVLFENIFSGRVDMTKRWNSDPEIAGGGVLIDNGTHSVDIARYLLGELAEVQGMEGARLQALQVEDTAKMFVRSQSGVLGSIDLSWSVSKQLPYFIALYGSGGVMLVGWGESKYKRNEDQEWTVFGPGYDKHAAFLGQIENFAGAIRGDEPLLIEPADAFASVRVIEAAYRSLAERNWEPVAV